jgi:ureidoglycolate hydrolase
MSGVVEMVQLRVPVVRATPEAFAGLGQVVRRPTGLPTVTRPGLRFWSRVGAMDIPGEVEMGILELTAQDFVFDSLERHVRTQEMFIPLEGVAIMPIGLGAGADRFPRPEEIRGFLIDSQTSIIMNPGVWHWIPYPLSPVASYLIPALVGTPTEDREVRQLENPLHFEI